MSSINVVVEFEDGTKVIVPCEENQQVGQLMSNAMKRYAKVTQQNLSLLPKMNQIRKNGAVLLPEDLVKDVLENGASLTAVFSGSGLDRAQHSEMVEHTCKVLVVGEGEVGKTSIISRYVNNVYTRTYKMTVGVDFFIKEVQWDPFTVVKLCLWDIAGQERFGTFTRVYYQQARAAFVVFDATKSKSSSVGLDSTIKWKKDIDDKVQFEDHNLPVVLLANKVDLLKPGEEPSADLLTKFCEQYDFAGWFYTSAKDGTNLEEAGKFLIGRLFACGILNNSGVQNEIQDPDAFKLDDQNLNKGTNETKTDSGCGCS